MAEAPEHTTFTNTEVFGIGYCDKPGFFMGKNTPGSSTGQPEFKRVLAVAGLHIFTAKSNIYFNDLVAMKEYREKVVWVTGASSGIGRAVALELSKYGSCLILSSRSVKKLEAVRQECAHPGKTRVVALDLGDFKSMDALVQQALDQFGHIDILINNAGISQRSLIADTALEVYEDLIRINYLGTVALTTALLPHMIERNQGQVVTVTSLMGKFGSPLRSGYCGAKHALHGFMDVLRMELHHTGIDVTLICPGFVQTAIARNALTGTGEPQEHDDQATSRGMPADVFARKMLRAVARKKFEAYIGGKETMGVYVKRFFPKLLHKLVLRSEVV